jgi:hypothetical protein
MLQQWLTIADSLKLLFHGYGGQLCHRHFNVQSTVEMVEAIAVEVVA